MWDWMFGSGDDGSYERYMFGLYKQQNLEYQRMCCTHGCDLCHKQVKLGEQKAHSLGIFCANCYNDIRRVENLMRQREQEAEQKKAAAIAAHEVECRNYEFAAAQHKEDREEIARLKAHVSRLQTMIVNMTKA